MTLKPPLNTKTKRKNRMTPTKEQAKAAFAALAAIAETIRELREVPSGVLYAHLMGKMSLETYQSFIGRLINAGLVEEDQSHLLRWVGPTFPSGPTALEYARAENAKN
jgi:hypothetical protein